MKDFNLYAHSIKKADGSIEFEPLLAHLEETERLVEKFADAFNCANFAKFAAKYHDLGKASAEFQNYLRESTEHPERRRRGPDHSTAGAQFLEFLDHEKTGITKILAYAIAGHHAGLPNGTIGGDASLKSRLKKDIPEWESFVRKHFPANAFDTDAIFNEMKKNLPDIRRFFLSGFSIAFLTRMIFSCLVDADFLATENFMNREKSKFRNSAPEPTIPELCERLNHYMQKFSENASPLSVIRNEIRNDCLAAADLPPGFFTLSVPTGGGKTLSSLAFALSHAKKHHLSRVIYAIPFTSIIEQNAKVFRDAIGDESVLEHHSNAETSTSERNSENEEKYDRSRLATENWDAPVVVTTNVQFFESLFANKTSRCRKLHNIAKSVIILDEVQTLPIPLLKPCLRALDELVKNYGATIVLCTATQPSVSSEKMKDGLRGNKHGIREIISPGRDLYERLRRTKVERIAGTLDEDSLAEKLSQERQVLAIVNTRKNAKDLFEKLRNRVPEEEQDSVFHLSALMYPQHRLCVLDKIRERLRENLPCRVVSTQLIEAGVDIDFPCVYRAMTGIDSIAQAAGRCNREWKLSAGRVFVFEPEELAPAGFLRNSADHGKQVLSLPKFASDPISQESVSKYFELHYWSNSKNMDEKEVLTRLIPDRLTLSPKMEALLTFRFKELGECFRFIEDDQSETVFVPGNDPENPAGEDGNALCENLRETDDTAEQRKIVRKLQRYAVSIPRKDFEKAVSDGTIEIIHDRYAVLQNTAMNYDKNLGIVLRDGGLNNFVSI